MKTRMLTTAMVLLSAIAAADTHQAIRYVKANTLNVRYAPTTESKKAGVLFRNQAVRLINDGNRQWHKIHQPESDLTGWVATEYLSSTPLNRHQRQLADRELVRTIIRDSDDFKLYESVFMQVTVNLLGTHRCKFNDFEAMHGWWRSLEHKERPVYYIYCGPETRKKTIYLDIRLQQTFTTPPGSKI